MIGVSYSIQLGVTISIYAFGLKTVSRGFRW